MGRPSRKCKRSAFCSRELQTSDAVERASEILGWLPAGWAGPRLPFFAHA